MYTDLNQYCQGVTNISATLNNYEQVPRRKVNDLKMLVLNFQSIKNKKDELMQILENTDIDVVIGCETHLNPNISDTEILHPAYTCYRNDREDGYGGVIIISKKELIVEEVSNSKSCEFLAVKIETHCHPLLLATAYRPPNSNSNDASIICTELTDLLQKYKTSPLWFCGDMNLPDVDWSTNSIISYQYSVEISECFLETFSICNLEQVVDFPTRRHNTLEIAATNRPNLLNKCEAYPGISDHETAVLLEIDCHVMKSKPKKRKIPVWNKVDYGKLKDHVTTEVSIFINSFTLNTNTNFLWDSIKLIVDSSMSLVPTKYISTRYSQPWITRECKRISRLKQRAYNRAKRTQTQADWDYFKKITKVSRLTCMTAFNDYIRNCIAPDLKYNPKRFFTFIKSKKCEKTGISSLKDKDGKLHITDRDKANILNDQFASVFSTKDNKIPNIISNKMPSIDDINITEAGVCKLLTQINVFKSTGPDDISARFLKEVANEISPALTLLFNASLEQGIVPEEWKQAIIFPIYKAGKTDRSNAENYRPISLTCVTCKILEHILYSNIIRHLDENKILTDVQHGFRKRRSCETQLITVVNDFAKVLNEGLQLDSILLDFSKAFDKVDHDKLCIKLEHYGINGKTLEWIKDFLNDRIQWVVINGENSSKLKVKSGVPQGSVLGPLLFLVYINDLPVNIKSKLRLFADDSYIYKIIKSKQDTIDLQNDLDMLVRWEKKWSMEFHPDKCKLLTVSNKRKLIETNYYIHDRKLDQVDEAKYLGLIIHKKLSWSSHVNMIIKKANQTRAFLQRNLRKCHHDVKSRCYQIYVRPILEYASTVWDPVGDGNQQLRTKLEMTQRKAARFVFNDWDYNSSPSKMIKCLKWQSLEERRYLARINFIHKFTNNDIDIDNSIIKRARGLNNNFMPVNARVQAYANSFVPATICDWNLLPPRVKNEKNSAKFKTELSRL